MLQVEHDQHVERRDRNAPGQWNPKQQLERDRGPDDLGEVARGNGDFANDPEKE